MNIRKILLPTDFSECANAALDHALFLARQHSAELHLLHVVVLHDDDPFDPTHHFPDSGELFERLQRLAAGELENLLTPRSTENLRIFEHQRRAFSAAPAIIEAADELGVDLIVLGGHGRRGLRRFFLGSVAEEVVRTAECPVLTLRQTVGERGVRPFERLLAPIDFSTPARQALGAARSLAEVYGAELHLLHVVEAPAVPPSFGPLYSAAAAGVAFGDLAREVEGNLRQLLEETKGPEVDSRLEVAEGIAAPTITRYAEQRDCDLIVIATHGLTGLEHFLLGSVTEKVMRTAPCPVLVLKQENASDLMTAEAVLPA